MNICYILIENDLPSLVLGFQYLLHRPHRPMVVVLNTARDLLDTNQIDQRVVLHNLTQVMTYCCPYACRPRPVTASTPDELIALNELQIK